MADLTVSAYEKENQHSIFNYYITGDTDNGIAFYLCILRIIQAGSDGRLKNEYTASG